MVLAQQVALLCAALAGADADERKDVPPRPPVEVVLKVLSGRASLVQGEKVETLTRVGGAREIAGKAYLELGTGSELELAWPGLSSVRLTGPAALEWTPPGADPMRIKLRLLRFDRLEAEVRRGSYVLDLPQAWSLDLGRGAISIEERPQGDLVITHRGGEDAKLRSRVQRAGKLPDRVTSGQRLRLRAR